MSRSINTKTVDSLQGGHWLANPQTPNVLCYSPLSNSCLKNIVIVAEINDLKSSFCAVLFHCFSIVMHNNCKDKYLENF